MMFPVYKLYKYGMQYFKVPICMGVCMFISSIDIIPLNEKGKNKDKSW